MTDKFLSRFHLLLEEIFQNGLRDRLPPEFVQLGKLLIICRNGRSHDGQVITSGWSKLVLETHVCWVSHRIPISIALRETIQNLPRLSKDDFETI